jgi:acyl transferase domain-containing protein
MTIYMPWIELSKLSLNPQPGLFKVRLKQTPPRGLVLIVDSTDEFLAAGDASRVNDAEFSQPLCTAVQIGLVNILSAWGVKPTSVIGHSSGEIAAAYAAGAITAEAAIVIAYYRGQLAKSSKEGAMAALGLGRDEVNPYLEDGVRIACENSPRSITISGDPQKVDQVLDRISRDKEDVFCRRLRVKVAYHSGKHSPLPTPSWVRLTIA